MIMEKRALILCYRRPYPLRSGAEVSMYQYIKILSEYCKVDVLYLSDQKEDKDKLNDVCNNVIVFGERRRTKYIRMIKNCILYKMPLQSGRMYLKEVQRWLNVHNKDYELILCMHIKMAPYIMKLALRGEISKKRLFFCGVDAISLQCQNACRVNKGWKKAAYMLEYKKMLSYEKKVYETMDNTIVISQRDRRYILEKVKAKCNPHIICNYAVDLGYQDKIEKEQCSICFMGRMDYNPNIAAVTYFVNIIYPKVKALYPTLRFHIIGGYATKQIESLSKINGITVHGFVENPAEYLQKSTVVIAPMRSGAGLQNKIIQAMYLGCTVITSEIGADGMVGLRGDELVVYHNDSELISRLIELLPEESAKRREEIGRNARYFIERNYSYDIVRSKIKEVFLDR